MNKYIWNLDPEATLLQHSCVVVKDALKHIESDDIHL